MRNEYCIERQHEWLFLAELDPVREVLAAPIPTPSPTLTNTRAATNRYVRARARVGAQWRLRREDVRMVMEVVWVVWRDRRGTANKPARLWTQESDRASHRGRSSRQPRRARALRPQTPPGTRSCIAPARVERDSRSGARRFPRRCARVRAHTQLLPIGCAGRRGAACSVQLAARTLPSGRGAGGEQAPQEHERGHDQPALARAELALGKAHDRERDPSHANVHLRSTMPRWIVKQHMLHGMSRRAPATSAAGRQI